MIIRNNLKLFIIVFITFYCWSFSCNIYGQGIPYFRNFSISDYNAGVQNWDISEAKNGKIYVANKKGLLEYDGVEWFLWELPNRTIIRSVLALNNRIYTGSLDEFGYWEKTQKGILKYYSITDNILIENFKDQEIWEIFEFNDTIFFRSFSHIYTYKNGEVKASEYNGSITSCNIIEEELLVTFSDGSIWKLKNNELLPTPTKFRSGEQVLNIFKVSEDDYFYTTAKHGCFSIKNNILKPWNTEVNELLKSDELNKVIYLPNGNFVFGTIKNGVYITNSIGEIIYHINRQIGLINNTVLSIDIKDEDSLWVGLDNGISVIDLDNHIRFINDYSGELGTAYDIVEYNKTIYIGSNTGLFYLDKKKGFVFIKNSEGQVWDLEIINNQLFCGTNNGTYLVEGNMISKISNFRGGKVIKKVPDQNVFIQGTYGGLVKFEWESDKWIVNRLDNCTIHTNNIVFEDTYSAWITHPQKGMYRVIFDENFNIKESINYKEKGLSLNYNIKVHEIKNNIVFHSNKGWFKYEFLKDTIMSSKLLNENFGSKSEIISDNIDNSIVAFNKNNNIFLKSLITDSINYIPTRYYQNRINEESLKVLKVNDSTYGLCLINGVMFLKSSFFNKFKILEPKIERIYLKNELIALDKNIELPYFNNSLTLELSSPLSENHFFEYKLTPMDEEWKKIETSRIEFNGLPDSQYELLFRTANDLNQKSDASGIEFLVNPPWYRSDEIFIVYLLITVFSFYCFHRFEKNRGTKKQKLLHKEFIKKQQKLLLQEKTKSLEKELTKKSKELSNTAITLANKNDALLKLKENIKSHRAEFINKNRIDKLVLDINSIIGNDNEFKLFESNFNMVHESFFYKLNEEFPQTLTKRDLKVCAFTKMELSTKEIATLLNISTRSVETHKFRLKKKLNLGKETNMTKYLKSII